MKILSRLTEYGILSACALARNPGQLMMVKNLASRYTLPTAFTRKAMEKLALHGILESFKGPKGGYRLKKSPHKITVWDIVKVLEEPALETQIGLGSQSKWQNKGLHLKPLYTLIHQCEDNLTQKYKTMSLSLLVRRQEATVSKAKRKSATIKKRVL